MIGIKLYQDSDKKGEYQMYFALCFNRERNAWVPVEKYQYSYFDALDAAKICTRILKSWYADVAEKARLIRLLSEHPDFDFYGDSIDASMVQRHIHELHRCIEFGGDDILRLLDGPNDNDRIIIGGMHYTTDPDNHTLVSCEEPRPADSNFLQLVNKALDDSTLNNGNTVSLEGLESALAIIERKLHKRKGNTRTNQ